MERRTQVLVVNHVGVTVPDIFGAIDWYSRVFGFRLIMGPREISGGGHGEAASALGPSFASAWQAHLLTANGVGLELFEFKEPAVQDQEGELAFWRRGIWHICFSSDDVATLATEIVAAGGRKRNEPAHFVPGKPWQLVYCEDPWGTVIELMSHSYAEVFSNWPQPGATQETIFVDRPTVDRPTVGPTA